MFSKPIFLLCRERKNEREGGIYVCIQKVLEFVVLLFSLSSQKENRFRMGVFHFFRPPLVHGGQAKHFLKKDSKVN